MRVHDPGGDPAARGVDHTYVWRRFDIGSQRCYPAFAYQHRSALVPVAGAVQNSCVKEQRIRRRSRSIGAWKRISGWLRIQLVERADARQGSGAAQHRAHAPTGAITHHGCG